MNSIRNVRINIPSLLITKIKSYDPFLRIILPSIKEAKREYQYTIDYCCGDRDDGCVNWEFLERTDITQLTVDDEEYDEDRDGHYFWTYQFYY